MTLGITLIPRIAVATIDNLFHPHIHTLADPTPSTLEFSKFDRSISRNLKTFIIIYLSLFLLLVVLIFWQ